MSSVGLNLGIKVAEGTVRGKKRRRGELGQRGIPEQCGDESTKQYNFGYMTRM